MDQYIATRSWVKERSNTIIKVLIAAVVVIAIGVIVWMFMARQGKNAAESLAAAMAAHEAIVSNPLPPNLPSGSRAFTTEDEKHREAYKAFEQAARDYPSQNGDIARYLGAVHQLHFEADKAESTLKELAQKGADIGAQARLGLAGRYEATSRNDEALAEYQKLKANPGPIPPALIDMNMARVYETMGKNKEAVDLYFGIANNKDLRSSTIGNFAVTRLTILAPEKVDQLPPPEPTNPMAGLGGLGGMSIPVR
jgi:tetratricopeptide (TPR) repeat protein